MQSGRYSYNKNKIYLIKPGLYSIIFKTVVLYGIYEKRNNGLNSDIFREKNIERISSPEQLDDFIKVARPSLWLIFSAIVVLIIGIAVWASFGMVEVKDENGNTQYVHPIEFVVN